MTRYAQAIVLGALATLALFLLMQRLIEAGLGRGDEAVTGQVIEFVRVREDTETERKRRMPRKLAQEEPPPPPDIDMARAPKPRNAELSTVSVNLDFGLEGGPGLGTAPSDADVMPLVRIEPTYPARAASRGIEGWVLLEFTITPAGTVRDPRVVDYEPSSIFNSAAIRAVKKWKYKPKIVDGAAVPREGVQVVLTFVLDEDSKRR